MVGLGTGPPQAASAMAAAIAEERNLTSMNNLRNVCGSNRRLQGRLPIRPERHLELNETLRSESECMAVGQEHRRRPVGVHPAGSIRGWPAAPCGTWP